MEPRLLEALLEAPADLRKLLARRLDHPHASGGERHAPPALWRRRPFAARTAPMAHRVPMAPVVPVVPSPRGGALRAPAFGTPPPRP